MAAVTVWTDKGMRTVASARDHIWYADEPIQDGGIDSAPTPKEMLLGALGSCMVITVHMYANHKNWPLDKVEVRLDIAEIKAADYPGYQGDARYVNEIHEEVIIHGDQLTPEQRERLREIAGKCPVRRVLINPTFFVDAGRIVEPVTI
jgi:uncharacterized OsmC-like protein